LTTYRSKLFGFPSNVFCHSHHLVNYRVHFLEKTRKKSSKTNSNWKEIESVLSHTPILPTLKTLFLTGKSDEKNNIINQVFSQLFFYLDFDPMQKRLTILAMYVHTFFTTCETYGISYSIELGQLHKSNIPKIGTRLFFWKPFFWIFVQNRSTNGLGAPGLHFFNFLLLS
jgi:hypothetical protein